MYYLDTIGVDAVESCTGAFINPNLALHTRFDAEAAVRRPSLVEFELRNLGMFLGDVILHPLRPSRLRVDSKKRRAVVE
jgi:hypothetical protein